MLVGPMSEQFAGRPLQERWDRRPRRWVGERLRGLLKSRQVEASTVFVRRGGGWLNRNLTDPLRPPALERARTIERQARATQAMGPQRLWDGYRDIADYPRSTVGARTSEEVRSEPLMGRIFAWIAAPRRPETIVEIGTAFGVSGMYWLAGLELVGRGTLHTFEANEHWGRIARTNLEAVSTRFQLTLGTFEDNARAVLGHRRVDIAFVDAIHTSAFVFAQYEILKRHVAPGALILFDDIAFSEDMKACWRWLAALPEVHASAEIGDRVGVIELVG